ncbi:MBL fold metallo-hydrolase [Insolitispirillum peregrinum]|uniref:Metallo-beta-lactamase superfamily protein n=1 Tax=Insolitispirillum peregrinum TaxID=80876 RepID=A0A1N7QBS4_9PROT|nr:MBL fold metallo-hydrolase [Insolitispirillum peregrinum]SIT20320.1 Metallo-beta-lactamase superfamily protein [Insolitispirillum peregrinum]
MIPFLSQSVDMVLALPIHGEAFLLRRGGIHVLVDSGYKKDNISNVIKEHICDVNRLDIVVCTHGDADHVGGLPDLLRSWGNSVGQVWLPGRWSSVIPQVYRDPSLFFNQLVNELDSNLRNPSDKIISVVRCMGNDENIPIIEQDMGYQIRQGEINVIEDLIDDPIDYSLDIDRIPPEPEWFINLRRDKEVLCSDVAYDHAYKSAIRKVKYRKRKFINSEFTDDICEYWLGLIETSDAIRNIAALCISHSIPTRWFDFNGFINNGLSSGGVNGFLVPINAIEQPSIEIEYSLYMNLTKINQESLVFFAPPRNSLLGVLFCADSPLGVGPNFSYSFLPSYSPLSPIVATVPHHGAESNAIAYQHLKSWGGVDVFLRAGGTIKQPGLTFLRQNDCPRLCTKCPKVGHSPMLSGVVFVPYYWPGLIPFGRFCDCFPPNGP